MSIVVVLFSLMTIVLVGFGVVRSQSNWADGAASGFVAAASACMVLPFVCLPFYPGPGGELVYTGFFLALVNCIASLPLGLVGAVLRRSAPPETGVGLSKAE